MFEYDEFDPYADPGSFEEDYLSGPPEESFPSTTHDQSSEFLDRDEQHNSFLDLYNRLGNNEPDASYLDPNDPELSKFKELSGQPPDSHLDEYYGRMPKLQDYKPSTGRRIAAILLGALSAGGDPMRAYSATQRHLYAPFQNAYNEWKNEGSGVLNKEKEEDTTRKRMLDSLKFSLRQKANTAQKQVSDQFKRTQEARRMAAEADKAKAREAALNAREENARRENERIQMEHERLGLAQERWNLQKQKDEEIRKARDERDAAASARLDRQNTALKSLASRYGIDTTTMTARDVANSIALHKAKNNNAFADLIQKDPESREGFKIIADPNSPRAKMLQIWMSNQIKRLFSLEVNDINQESLQ